MNNPVSRRGTYLLIHVALCGLLQGMALVSIAALAVVLLLSWMTLRNDTPDNARSLPSRNGAAPLVQDDKVVCPACGALNPKNTVFCIDRACHKALGEFKYVPEELQASRSRIERLADRVMVFVSKPHFIKLVELEQRLERLIDATTREG